MILAVGRAQSSPPFYKCAIVCYWVGGQDVVRIMVWVMLL